MNVYAAASGACVARSCSKAGMEESVTGIALPSQFAVGAIRTHHACRLVQRLSRLPSDPPRDTAAAGGDVGTSELDGHSATIVHPDHPSPSQRKQSFTG